MSKSPLKEFRLETVKLVDNCQNYIKINNKSTREIMKSTIKLSREVFKIVTNCQNSEIFDRCHQNCTFTKRNFVNTYETVQNSSRTVKISKFQNRN